MRTTPNGRGRPCRANVRAATAGVSTGGASPRFTVPSRRSPRYAKPRRRLLGRPMQPLTLCAYEVDAEPVFDATDPTRLRDSEVHEADLACPTWEVDMFDRGVAASQLLAERLVAAGFVGMLVRSLAIGASEEDLNPVMWRWADARPTCGVIDEEGRLGRV